VELIALAVNAPENVPVVALSAPVDTAPENVAVVPVSAPVKVPPVNGNAAGASTNIAPLLPI
jgi:hypothetical protein